MTEIGSILELQRSFFSSGKTLPVQNRMDSLRRLKQVLAAHEAQIYQALYRDLGKSQTESYMCELGLVYSEISYMLSHVRKFAREKTVATPLAQFASRSYVKPTPRGVTLIMSPWNYPLLLTLDPLVDALAAGNTAVVKPSAYAPATAALLRQLLEEAFEPGLVSVVTGGRAENQQLLEQKFDYIFFTGSPAVGKEVLRCAAPHLTPVALELGGKSPCIVDKTADISVAARRIVFGKFLNCGQTCVAPDYLCCEKSILEPLTEAIEAEICRQFGPEPLKNPAYGRIVNEKHYHRLTALLEQSRIQSGGQTDPDACRIAPTLLAPGSWEDAAMQEEIFGPILPILPFEDLETLLNEINARPHPLALYFFSRDKAAIRHVTAACPFGGGCINDTVIHLATSHMGFGGVGNSGMGAYHGRAGFDAFTHYKSIVNKKTWLDLPMRYQPYTEFYDKLVRMFLH